MSPALFGIAGWSGSGKTTLVRRLIPELKGRDLRVATVKRAHHDFDVDQPGKDSYEHRRAGADQVMVSSARRWALMTELRGAPEPSLQDLVAKLDPCDLVLVEGFKRAPHPKLEVYRVDSGSALLAPDTPSVIAIASDAQSVPGAPAHLPILPLGDVAAIVDFILGQCGLAAGRNDAA